MYANTVDSLFGDDISGTYGTDWVVFAFDPNNDNYFDPGLNGIIKQGVGCWVVQTSINEVILDLPINLSLGNISYSSQCPSVNGCFEIKLTAQNNGIQWLMLGNPNGTQISWTNLRITTSNGNCADADVCTFDEAKNLAIFHKQGWHYNPV